MSSYNSNTDLVQLIKQLIELYTSSEPVKSRFSSLLLRLLTSTLQAEAGLFLLVDPNSEPICHSYLTRNSSIKSSDMEIIQTECEKKSFKGLQTPRFHDTQNIKKKLSFKSWLEIPIFWHGHCPDFDDLNYRIYLGSGIWFFTEKYSTEHYIFSLEDLEYLSFFLSHLLSCHYNCSFVGEGFIDPLLFRYQSQLMLSSFGIMDQQVSLAVIPLRNLDQNAGSVYIDNRARILKTIWQFISKNYPTITIAAVDEANYCYFFIIKETRDKTEAFLNEMSARLANNKRVSKYFCPLRIGLAYYPDQGENARELMKNALAAQNWLENTDSESTIRIFDPNDRNGLFRSDTVPGYWTDSNPLNYRNTGILIQTIETMRYLHKPVDVEKSLIEKAIELTGAERGMLLMKDHQGSLSFVSGRWAGGRPITAEPNISQSIPAQVLESGDSLCYVTMEPGSVSAPGKSIQELQLLSVMCTPLFINGIPGGVLYVDSRKNRNEFAESDLIFFQTLGRQMSVVLEATRLFEENKLKQKEIEKLNQQLQAKLDRQTVHLIDVEKELAHSQSQLRKEYRYDNIIGASPAMRELFSLLDRIAPYDYPILIEGESGTGKELVAKAIHFNSSRRDNRFVSENCGAIPDTLFEAELFGHTKGAFTGAVQDRKGLIQLAEGGTLFLDEVSNMSDAMQKGILRVIQEKNLRPVGSKRIINVDIRLICSSNISLLDMVDQGTFREDLFYRLNVITIQLPPLRDRNEDIPLLVNHFLQKTAKETDGNIRRIHTSALSVLSEYHWPGNVRELENEIRRLHIFSEDVITEDMVSAQIRKPSRKHDGSSQFPQTVTSLKDHERDLIISALDQCKGSKVKAARILGISRTNLYQKLKRYDIEE